MSTFKEEKKVNSTDAVAHKATPDVAHKGSPDAAAPTASTECAAHKAAAPSNTFEGKVISMTGNKLVMSNKEGKECSHTLANDAKLTCDGTACEAADVKAGSKIRVTTKQDDRHVATCIESLDKKTEFASCS